MTPLNILIRFVWVATLVTFSLPLVGCYGSRETDDLAYILMVGIDKAEGGKTKVTYQLAVPTGISTSGGTDGGKKVNWKINSIVTPSPAEARMLLNSTTSRFPNITHIYAYIYSEELAREGIYPHLSVTARSHEFRETLFLLVVPGSAEEYIKQNKPTLEAQIHRFYEATFSSASQSGYYLPATFHDFYTRLKNAGGSPYTVYSSINPMTGMNKPAGTKTPEQKGAPYLSGGIPRIGTENPIDFAGLAVFRGDKMIGVLNSDETRAVAILQGKSRRSYIGVIDPLQQKKGVINLEFRCDHKPKITAALYDGSPVFDVAVEVEAEILSISSGINYEAPDYRILLEAQVANLIKGQIMTMIKHTQALGTDPVGFGVYLRPQFQSTNELNQTDLTALYQAADICVNVTAKIRLTGREWRSSPDRKE